jgi:hypothetical protein
MRGRATTPTPNRFIGAHLRSQKKRVVLLSSGCALLLGNLATLHLARGRYAEAEPLYKRAPALFEKIRRPDHPNVAKALGNPDLIYRQRDRNGEAEFCSTDSGKGARA